MKFALDFFGAGDQDGRVTEAARGFNNLNREAGDMPRGVNHLAYAEAAPVAEIVDKALGRRVATQPVKSQEMCGGQVADVNVVANACAIGSGVIRSEDGDAFAHALGGLKDDGNQVGFGVVVFPEIAGGPGGIEIAQAGVTETVDAMKPVEHALDEQLRFAVSVGGLERIALLDGDVLRVAIQRRGGGKNEARNAEFENGFEQGESVAGIVAEIFFGGGHGFAGFDGSSQMHDAVERVLAHQIAEEGTVAEIAGDRACAAGQRVAIAFAEIVENGDVMAGVDKSCCDNAADVTGATGDQDLQFAASHDFDRTNLI